MHTKYPRTYHLPWSPGATDDDKIMSSLDILQDREVVVTEKMDGENTTMYRDHIHARSIDSRNHPSREWVKNLWAQIRWQIPEDVRICGENLYAQHSLAYDNLPSYFMGFSVWTHDLCWDWDFTAHFLNELNLAAVPVLYRGPFDRALIEALHDDSREGYVVRTVGGFSYDDFSTHVGKFVRKNHVETDEHWMHRAIKPNKLADTD